MSYKEVYYFVAMCLTISQEKKNRQIIEARLKKNDIDWEFVVEVSTGHYVFPAMYCALKREGFLTYLPQELLNFMEHVANTNRDRNTQIISQAKELNTFLLSHNITPIFIKGTANLLAGLYSDITERMVGDIDFLFSSQDYPKAIQVLTQYGYCKTVESDIKHPYPWSKHYPRLIKDGFIAAIEIHDKLLIEDYTQEFNYDTIKSSIQVLDNVAMLSDGNMLNLSILANQINDDQFFYKRISLRNAYDVFLLSKKCNAKNAVNTISKLSHPLHCFLAACGEVFNTPDSLEYTKTKKTKAYLALFKEQFTNPRKANRRNTRIKLYIHLKLILTKFYKAVIYKQYRIWLFYYIIDVKSYNKQLDIWSKLLKKNG
ncbi:nucleotidyltransferase family protein [Flavobacteriaceae bacterium]|nr:nucleotidyltransferase family protein [Flavobacteriaceae bacterium]